jgi:carboxyl-terminal processing protease
VPGCHPRRAHRPPAVAIGLLLLAAPLAAQGASYEQLQTFSSLLNQIRQSYVDSVTYAELVQGAIDGVLSSLDPHSRFVRVSDARRELAYEAGELAGTGIVLDEVDDRLTVLAVLPRSPGAKAGVAAGDRLLSIDDTAVAGLTISEAGRRLLGEKGRKVRLLFERGSRLEPDSVRITLKLDFLKPRSVESLGLADPATGYVSLGGFHFKGGQELEKSIKELQRKGARRLILDLRDNPGGSVLTAVEIAGLFLPRNTVVFSTEGRRRSATAEHRTERDGPFRDLPLMVLVDGGSASASEAVAGSLQDHDRALILGRRTFGKALMQQLFEIPPQGDVVWLTTARVVTPSGRIIQRSYRGLRVSQYRSLAGQSGAAQDTSAIFYTDRKRPIRGGGGIVPDVSLPAPVKLPRWWSVAADSGWYEAVADSVAGQLPKDLPARARWLDARAEWQTALVGPFMSRVRNRLNLQAAPDSALAARLGRILAYRVAEVRWGPEAADEFALRNDPDIRAAMTHWDKLSALLGGN